MAKQKFPCFEASSKIIYEYLVSLKYQTKRLKPLFDGLNERLKPSASLYVCSKDGRKFSSDEEFASQIEPKNVPAVFKGCIKDWKAFSNWNPSNGGLDYLQGLVGSSTVEATLSKSAPVFYGDIRSYERVSLAFATFIAYCKKLYQNKDEDRALCSCSENCGLPNSETEQDYSLVGDAPQQIYLPQVPIMNMEDEEKVHL